MTKEELFEYLKIIKVYLVDGFSVGGLTISLWNIFLALVFFFILLKLCRWLKIKLETVWLAKTSLSQSAREATTSIAWYAAVGLITLIAAGISGINLSNLALVAGALSVGIGFGLQNIVSNFISGLIILFERPVKRGDWIIVGNTQGFVKEINIRSTRIQTFDYADVLIPNSELLTNQLTNWMLSDPIGRITIPIGVAYGTDTNKVAKILLDIANNHSETIRNHAKISEPQVLFQAFGDSSLNFELRFFVKDIQNCRKIQSDINFEIDRKFKEECIQIPFPQRDVYIRNMDEPGNRLD